MSSNDLSISAYALVDSLKKLYDCIAIVDGDRVDDAETWGILVRKIEDGPIPGKPFLVFDLCPFDHTHGAIWGFLAQAATTIAYIDSTTLKRQTTGNYNVAMGNALALHRYNALITGQPDADALEMRLRRLLGPAMPPIHAVPMTARGTVKAMTPAQTRRLPGLEGGRILLLASLNTAGACSDQFISALGRIEARNGTPFVAVIVGQDSLPLETPEEVKTKK